MLILRSDQLVLSAHMAITGLAPSNAVFNSHLAIARAPGGEAAWISAVNDFVNANFGGTNGTARLADALIANLGLGAVTGIRDAAIAFLNSQPANRGGLAIAAADWLRTVEPAAGDTALIAAQTAFRSAFTGAFTHSTNPASGNFASTLPGGQLAGGGQVFTLTIGVDNLTGTAGNDTFNAVQTGTALPFSTADSLDGGAGTDTLNWVETAAITGVPVASSVKNIEIANVTSGAAITLNSTGWSGLERLVATSVGDADLTAATSTHVTATVAAQAANGITVTGGKDVTVTAAGGNATTGTLTVSGATGAVNVTATGATLADGTGLTSQTQGNINVTGGTTVTVNSFGSVSGGSNDAGDALNLGAVAVTGTALTTAVTVTQTAAQARVGGTDAKAAIVNGNVTINDVNRTSTTAAGTIETVSITNAGAVTVNSGALKTLNLGGTLTTVDAGTLGALNTPANTTLALNLNGATSTGAVTIDNDITTLNVGSATTKSSLHTLTANGATTVNVAGDAALTVTNALNVAANAAINVTNTAGVSLTPALGNAITFTGGAGADSIVLGATTKAHNMGDGNDVVTYTALLGTGGSVDGGAGTDRLVLDIAVTTTAEAARLANFEVLQVNNGVDQDVSLFSGITAIRINDGAGETKVRNLTAAQAAAITVVAADTSGAITIGVANAETVGNIDTVKITVDDGATTVGNINLGTPNIAGVENLFLTAVDNVTGLTLTSATAVNQITLDGAGTISIATGNQNAANFTINGAAATGNLTLDAGAQAHATIGVALTGGSGADTLTGSARDDVLNGGTGDDTINGGSGNDIINGGAGNDGLNGEVGNDTINGGDGNDRITGGAGNDALTGGAGVDTFVFSSAATNGADTITDFAIGTGGDVLNLAVVATLVGTGVANVVASGQGNTATHQALRFTDNGPTDFTDLAAVAAFLNADPDVAGPLTTRLLIASDVNAGNANTVLLIDNGTNTAVYLFSDNATSNATVEASELTLLATLTGVADATTVANLTFA